MVLLRAAGVHYSDVLAQKDVVSLRFVYEKSPTYAYQRFKNGLFDSSFIDF